MLPLRRSAGADWVSLCTLMVHLAAVADSAPEGSGLSTHRAIPLGRDVQGSDGTAILLHCCLLSLHGKPQRPQAASFGNTTQYPRGIVLSIGAAWNQPELHVACWGAP